MEWVRNDPQVNVLPHWRLLQRFVLATLFYSTGGATSWVSNSGWLSYEEHECYWYNSGNFTNFPNDPGDKYIHLSHNNPCEEDLSNLSVKGVSGVYRHLWLRENNLRGSIPTELYLLSSLRSISVHANALQGPICSHIALLTNLEAISLGVNDLTSSIPAEIGLLGNLTGLFLLANQLTGSVSALQLLVYIFPGTFLTCCVLKIPNELFKLDKLESLALDFNMLSSSIPSEIGQLENMSQLELFDNVRKFLVW